jgi:hypothetical protein
MFGPRVAGDPDRGFRLQVRQLREQLPEVVVIGGFKLVLDATSWPASSSATRSTWNAPVDFSR